MKKKPHPSIASTTARMKVKKRIGLVAHDYRKRDLIDWIDYNRVTLSQHELFGTGTTGGLIQEKVGLDVHRFMSGPLRGDLQLAAAIADNKFVMLFFFCDSLHVKPNDLAVKAMIRICC